MIQANYQDSYSNSPLDLSSIESEKNRMLKEIYEYIQEYDDQHLFKNIVEYRVDELGKFQGNEEKSGNLYYTLTSPEALENAKHRRMTNVPDYYHTVEKIAEQYFGGILACWTEYEIFLIASKPANEAGFMNEMYASSVYSIYSEMGYQAELIADVSQEQRVFLTHFCDKPLSLADANVLINLETFVKEQHWYEMLFDLDLSASGEHFILYQKDESGNLVLFSSAKIQRWQQKDKWLAFAPFFQSEKWTLNVTGEKLIALEKSGVFSDELVNKVDISSLERFDNSLSKNVVVEDAMCELVRMAVSGPGSKINQIFFLTMKNIILLLKSARLDVVYIITEQPSILYFFESVNLSDMDGFSYIQVSQLQVDKRSPVTHKGFFLSQPMGSAIKNCSYRDYYKRILSVRRQSMEAMHA